MEIHGQGAEPMGTEIATHRVECIGDVAGQVWHYLDAQGPVTLSKLARDVDAPRDLVMQGIGWLAREEKIVFLKGNRSKQVGLA